MHAIRHATAGTFHVENHMGPRIYRGNIHGTASFDQYPVARIAQPGNERNGARLSKRLAPRDFNKAALKRPHLIEQLIDRELASSMKGIFRIAPDTAEWTTGQSHKDAWFTRETRFALNAMKNLCDTHD